MVSIFGDVPVHESIELLQLKPQVWLKVGAVLQSTTEIGDFGVFLLHSFVI